jgi:hypothetical protein
MRSSLLTILLLLATAAAGYAQSPLDSFERKVWRYAPPPLSPAKTLCICRNPSGLNGGAGRLIATVREVSGAQQVQVYCSVPLFGHDDQIQQTAHCYDFITLTK